LSLRLQHKGQHRRMSPGWLTKWTEQTAYIARKSVTRVSAPVRLILSCKWRTVLAPVTVLLLGHLEVLALWPGGSDCRVF
jgi:hypothetical protein